MRMYIVCPVVSSRLCVFLLLETCRYDIICQLISVRSIARKVTWRRGNHSLLLIAKVFVDAMRFVFVNKSALRGDFVNKCCSWVGVEGR